MSALGYTTTNEPIVGWRSWRVLPFDRLDGSWTYRLAAVGTLGVPKFWEPRQPTVAACSDYLSEHASPWPDCECGIWALHRPEEARRRMVRYMGIQSGEPAGWAYGRVSLWGRVIEHEKGWRGQLAYPYALVVESADEAVARVLRDAYAIDVEWAGAALFEKVRERRRTREEERQRAKELAEQEAAERRTKLDETIAGLEARSRGPNRTGTEAWRERAEREQAEADEAVRAKTAIPALDDLTVDDVLAALVTEVAAWSERVRDYPDARSLRWSMTARDVTECVLYARGEGPPLETPRVRRVGLREAHRAVLAKMREAREDGLLEYGKLFEDRNSPRGGNWFITRRGLSRVAKLTPRTRPYHAWHRGQQTRFDVDLAQGVRLLRRHKRPPFVEEVEVLLPTWMEERRAAQQLGSPGYEEWLQERRKAGRPEMLWFTDDEIEDVVRRAGKPVRQVDVMAVLAPAATPGDRLKGETSRFAAQLARLAKSGRVVRRTVRSKTWWEPAGENLDAALHERAAALAAAPPVIQAIAASLDDGERREGDDG